MMVDIIALAAELKQRTEWQRTPEEISDADYCHMIHDAIRNLLVMTGRTAQYREDWMIYENDVPVAYNADLMLDEIEYITVVAEIGFYRKVQTDVNAIVGYTTDALSITNADRPYVYLSTTIRELEKHRRVLYYKMTRFSVL